MLRQRKLSGYGHNLSDNADVRLSLAPSDTSRIRTSVFLLVYYERGLRRLHELVYNCDHLSSI